MADCLEPWSTLLESRGYPPAEARDTVLTMLPDILRNRPAQCRNGRVLTDDVCDTRVEFLTVGKVTSDDVEPHEDDLTESPHLGLTNVQPSATTAPEVRCSHPINSPRVFS